ncbi:MAG: tetratricopeptide repeat protein [Anaerolineae bacterium]|nr:tetratricopeptide repeat protein [Anaerolineae bacterium]
MSEGYEFRTLPVQIKSRRTLSAQVPTLLAILAVVVAVVALIFAVRDDMSRPEPRLDGELDSGGSVVMERARDVMDRANDAVASVNNMLSVLEVTFGVLSVVMIFAGWVMRAMILDQIDEARAQEARLERRLSAREERLDQLEQRLEDRMREMVAVTQTDIAKVKTEGRDSFRVLSLQLLAEQQVREHNIDTAISTLKMALEIDPDDHASNYLLGYLHTARKEIKQAIVHLERALAAEPDFAPAIAALGLALRRRGDGIKDPERIAERNQQWAQAESKLLQALRQDASLTDADGESYYGTLGGLYRRQGRYDDALDSYERAHDVTPDSSYPVINLASLHKHQGHDERAAHFFEMVIDKALLALDDDPRDVWTRADYAQARLVLGEVETALEQIEIMIKQQPGPGVLETVHSGLQFLRESHTLIAGLDQMIGLIEAEFDQRRVTAEMAALAAQQHDDTDDDQDHNQ